MERQIELRRRRSRKKKMMKLKAKLAAAKSDAEKDAIRQKILRISPWWTEPKEE